ncbi:unnamed protein product [Ceutorhynchus assimilis]|uniref:Uncharacterized protein n=1 Tax=Ceutorhynchus assimilis TaxID=467358 RepID=A0A9N9MFU0_9CUCU|nr:unnamed protein product [Ceutorhynchus assimilis]
MSISQADTETIYSDSNGTTDGVELERVIEQDNLPGPSFTQKKNLPGPSWQNADTSNDVSSGLEELEETLRNLIRPSLPEFDLKTLLQTSPLGNSVLQFYNANGSLDQKRRNRLVDIMIKHIFNHIVKQSLIPLFIDSLYNGVNDLHPPLDSKITTQITLLPHLIPPKGRTVIEKKHWKFSTQESVESLVVLVKNPGDIEKTIAEQKEKSLNKKQTVQPYILVDGPDLINFRRIFLVVDTLRYQFDCPKKAFDILFKAYHVFKAKYPLPGEHIYLLIQRCIYKIKTKYNIIQPYVLNILQQLEYCFILFF